MNRKEREREAGKRINLLFAGLSLGFYCGWLAGEWAAKEKQYAQIRKTAELSRITELEKEVFKDRYPQVNQAMNPIPVVVVDTKEKA